MAMVPDGAVRAACAMVMASFLFIFHCDSIHPPPAAGLIKTPAPEDRAKSTPAAVVAPAALPERHAARTRTCCVSHKQPLSIVEFTMKGILFYALAARAILYSPCSAFSIHSRAAVRLDAPCQMKSDGHDDYEARQLSRRSAISIFTTLLPASILASSNPLTAGAEGKGKIVVMGGAGWVGAHVASDLDKRGYGVVSISRSSPEVQTERTKSILGKTISGVDYVSLDAGTASIEDLASVMKDALAVVSCVGISPGSPNQKDGNGLVNSRIAKAAKTAGVPKFVYIGVASSLANGPAKFLLGD